MLRPANTLTLEISVTQILILLSLIGPSAMAKQDSACAAKIVACQIKCSANWPKIEEDCESKCGSLADCNSRQKAVLNLCAKLK